ncbi:hypothetical protein DFS34DRAFT_385441 [Phlyctochytrium arcticum]|nr:hypothetical protein DFS34DRAFT_385441 [Phlyctochytrium arcticum]
MIATTRMISSRRIMTARRVGGIRISQRFQHSTPPPPSTASSHALAGAAGGAAVLAGAYGYYYFSGAKTFVDTASTAKDYYKDITVKAKKTLQEKTPDNAHEALESLRSLTKSYASVIPGASSYIDATFDSLDEIRDEHGDDFDRIVTEAYDEVKKIIQSDKSGLDMVTGTKIVDVLKRRGTELKKVAKDASKTAFSELEDKFPGVAKKLGGGYQEFQELAAKAGPEAKKTLDDVSKQMNEMFKKGLTPETLKQASELIKSKTEQIKELTKKQGSDAWNKGLEQAKPYLDKVPELRDLLNKNSSGLMASAAAVATGGSSSFSKIFDQVKDIAESSKDDQKAKIAKFKEFLASTAQDTKDAVSPTLEKGLDSLQDWVKVVPGGKEALDKVPDMSILVRLSQEKGDDAKALAQETYDEIAQVLQAKAEKAKKLIGEGKKQVEKESSKAEKESKNSKK